MFTFENTMIMAMFCLQNGDRMKIEKHDIDNLMKMMPQDGNDKYVIADDYTLIGSETAVPKQKVKIVKVTLLENKWCVTLRLNGSERMFEYDELLERFEIHE